MGQDQSKSIDDLKRLAERLEAALDKEDHRITEKIRIRDDKR